MCGHLRSDGVFHQNFEGRRWVVFDQKKVMLFECITGKIFLMPVTIPYIP